MRQCPAWAYAAQRDACSDAGAKQNAPHESEVRGVHPGSAWWVCATKKINVGNGNEVVDHKDGMSGRDSRHNWRSSLYECRSVRRRDERLIFSKLS